MINYRTTLPFERLYLSLSSLTLVFYRALWSHSLSFTPLLSPLYLGPFFVFLIIPFTCRPQQTAILMSCSAFPLNLFSSFLNSHACLSSSVTLLHSPPCCFLFPSLPQFHHFLLYYTWWGLREASLWVANHLSLPLVSTYGLRKTGRLIGGWVMTRKWYLCHSLLATEESLK